MLMNKMETVRRFCLTAGTLLLYLFMNGCTASTVTFSADGDASVALVTAENVNDPGDPLGKAPVTVPVEKIKNKLVKVSADGKVPQYYIAGDFLNASSTTVKAKLQDLSQVSSKGNETKSQANLTHRLLLESYVAITKRDWPLAIKLADGLNKIAPQLAGPYIVKGLAQLQQGNRDDAKASFTQAKALDPEDKNIDDMIRVVQ
jgi:tetratricopeptide (TPR) repeat protein